MVGTILFLIGFGIITLIVYINNEKYINKKEPL